MTRHPALHRATATLGLLASLAGLPVLLHAATGPPSLAGLPTAGGVREVVRDQYLPLDPVAHLLGTLAWGLWAYAVLVVVLRAVAVAATRWQLAGAGTLLTVSNLVTVPALRSLVDAAVGLSLLASAASPPANPPATAPLPPTVAVQAAEAPPTWDRARALLEAVRTPHAGQPRPGAGKAGQASTAVASVTPDRQQATGEPYEVKPGDSLWRIAQRRLGDPLRWREIWELNKGRDMGDGRSFRHAGLLLPGWVLYLPPDQRPPARPPNPPAHRERKGQADTPPAPAVPTTALPGTAPATPPATRPGGEASPGGDQPDRGRRSAPRPASPAVELPSGAVVGLSLAAGIVLALAAARLHRRRRRPLGEPEPGITHRDPLVTATVRRLRHAVHAASRPDPDQADDEAADGATRPAPPATTPAQAATAPARPGVVPLGRRGEREATVDLTAGGLALTGPTAPEVARAMVTTMLAGAQPDTVEVLVAGQALADELLAGVGPVPGLRVTADLDAALSTVEVELVHRLRLLQGHDAGDVADYLAVDPAEPLPAVVLVADMARGGEEWERRLAGVLTVGGRLGVGALLLGRAAGVPVVTLGPHAEVQATEPGSAPAGLLGVQAFTLTAADARELLAVVAAGRGLPRPPETAAPTASSAATTRAVPDSRVPPGQRPVRVRCLGPLRIELNGAEVRTGLRSKARELLAFLLLHPDGAAREALWPEADPARGAERAKDALKSLRQALRAATGQSGATVVELVGERWRVNPELLDCDVWAFQAAVAAAAAAADAQAKLDALAKAAAAYGGTLLDGEAFDWPEEAREELRRQAADVAGRLAELREQAGDLDGAVAALEDGARWDAYNEELHQRIMRLQARLGRMDAVRRTYDRLQERLADLGVDPDEATQRLLRDLRRGSTARR